VIRYPVSFRDTELDKLRIAVNWRRDRSVNAKTNANSIPCTLMPVTVRKKKSITYCNVRNEILRLIKHSYLACDGRDGHCSKKETAEARAVAISLTSKVSAKVSQSRMVFQSRTSVWKKALQLRTVDETEREKDISLRTSRQRGKKVWELSSDQEANDTRCFFKY